MKPEDVRNMICGMSDDEIDDFKVLAGLSARMVEALYDAGMLELNVDLDVVRQLSELAGDDIWVL